MPEYPEEIHASRPDQRHMDLTALSQKMSVLIRVFWIGVTCTIGIIGTAAWKGVGILVDNNYTQKRIVEKMEASTVAIGELRNELRTTSERTSIMWFHGGYGKDESHRKQQ